MGTRECPDESRWLKQSCATAQLALLMGVAGCHIANRSHMPSSPTPVTESFPRERQITRAEHGHILTNTRVWSPDSEWIVYDTRSDVAGDLFDGNRIEMVNIHTGEVKSLYESRNGACCGVATFHPQEPKVVFILGPENPSPDWQYNAWHRQGVEVDTRHPGEARNLDARDLTEPLTPGALRGGSHVHVWDAAGDWLSFTYEDHLLAQFKTPGPDQDINQRNIGVSAPVGPVTVSKDHPRNHGGDYFTILATRTTAQPKPGSDEISKAFEEGWVGTNGYLRTDGTRQRRAIAFLGQVTTGRGETIAEVFIADLPNDLKTQGDGPLCGTATRLPSPPSGTTQRRLTFTSGRKFPGIEGPRHWLRTSPDGSRIAFLMRDDSGIVQLWTVSPNGAPPVQVTRNPWSIASTFNWSPDGKRIVHLMDNSVFVTEVASAASTRLTPRSSAGTAPRPEACVFSPDGRSIAFVRRVAASNQEFNQVFVLALD